MVPVQAQGAEQGHNDTRNGRGVWKECERRRGTLVNKIEQLPLKSFKCYCLCALPQVISTLVILWHAPCFLLTQSFSMLTADSTDSTDCYLQPSACLQLELELKLDSLLLFTIVIAIVEAGVAAKVEAKYVSVSKLQLNNTLGCNCFNCLYECTMWKACCDGCFVNSLNLSRVSIQTVYSIGFCDWLWPGSIEYFWVPYLSSCEY